jgi:branched-subunit amino acid aminotransferase/4-amino-4-deoxychorismate lyase
MSLLAVAVSGRGLVSPDEPVVHADDEAFMRGRGAFETMRVYGSRPFRFDEHVVRLEASCARLGFVAPNRDEVERLADGALRAAGADEAMLRIYATPGRDDAGPLAIVVVGELPLGLEEMRARGIQLITVAFQPAQLIGGIKSTSYALNMIAVDEARARGADDAVFLGEDGVVLEATTANIWWRRKRVLFTPALDVAILAGVTRSVLAEAAPALGYDVVENTFPVAELTGAEEAFTTSSVREVMPVVGLDGSPVGDGRPGRAAGELQVVLRELACRN